MATGFTMNEVLAELKAAMKKNEKRHRKFHIVFIGASGAGKTSLLNLIGHLGVMNELECDGITAFKRYTDDKLERAQNDPMVSKTSITRSYDMQIGDVTLMITDTPGLGLDSAGIGKEKENVENIVEHLKKVEYVNCICLVINGRTPRGIPEVRYALSEIAALLPNVAANNMIMCLTNCERISKACLDLNILTEFFKSGIDRNNTFCIDNPHCILENARRLKQIEDNTEDIICGFDLANKEFKRILHRIKEFDQLPTTFFSEVYAAKQAVEHEVLAITVHQHNREQLDLQNGRQGTSGAGKVQFTKVSLCYSNCHLRCRLPHSYDTEVFKNCFCMEGSSEPGICAKCKHSYVTHYHHYVRFHSQVIYLEYEKISAQIQKESTQALQNLFARIQEFHKISSTINYIQVLNTQLKVVQFYKRTYGNTEPLETAEARLQSAINAMQLVRQ